jgi:hypothetical protein
MTDEIATPVDTESTLTDTSTTPSKPASIEEPKSVKVKVNGKELDVSIEDLKRSYGLDKTAYAKLEEAAKLRKEVESIKSTFSQKKVESLLAAGWSEDEIEQEAANFIIKRAQEKSMSPAEREQLRRDQDYQRLKRDAESREQEEKNKTQRALDESQTKLYQTAFFSDVAKAEKSTWLDLNNPIILSNIINDITLAATKFNYDMSVTEAVKRQEAKLKNSGPTKKEYLREMLKNSIKGIDDTDLDAFLTNGGKGIRDKSVEAIKKSEAPFAKQPSRTQGNSTPVQNEAPVRDAKYYRDVKYGKIDPVTGKPR